jgi:MoxR-like ATPase
MHVVAAPSRSSRRLLHSLNLFGLDFLYVIVMATLEDQRPLLLNGPHGTAKLELRNRLAGVLHLEHRRYNASLISFDDLLG